MQTRKISSKSARTFVPHSLVWESRLQQITEPRLSTTTHSASAVTTTPQIAKMNHRHHQIKEEKLTQQGETMPVLLVLQQQIARSSSSSSLRKASLADKPVVPTSSPTAAAAPPISLDYPPSFSSVPLFSAELDRNPSSLFPFFPTPRCQNGRGKAICKNLSPLNCFSLRIEEKSPFFYNLCPCLSVSVPPVVSRLH